MFELLDRLTKDLSPADLPLLLAHLFILVAGVAILWLAYAGKVDLPFFGKIADIYRNFKNASNVRLAKVVLLFIGALFLIVGLVGVGNYVLTKQLYVVTSLAEEEYQQLLKVLDTFNEENHARRINVHSENVNPETLLEILQRQRVDLILFDITRRTEVVRENVIEKLSKDFERYVPSSVHSTLMEHMKLGGALYFLPYRPNVRIAWTRECKYLPITKGEDRVLDCCTGEESSSKAYCKLVSRGYGSKSKRIMDPPGTWQDLLKFAEDPAGKKKVVLSAKGYEDGVSLDAALLLFELVRAAGKSDDKVSPKDLCRGWDLNIADVNKNPLRLLRVLWASVSDKSKTTDQQTATGYLLADDVAVGRNWSFSISIMQESGEIWRFHPSAGWKWEQSELETLLGGDIIALPRNVKYREEAKRLIEFLLSKKAQKIMVQGLAWPPMRFDTRPPWREAAIPPEEAPLEGMKPLLEALVKALQPNPPERSKSPTHFPDIDEERRNMTVLHHERALAAVREAILHAKPTPDYWSPEMHQAYTEAFKAIVKGASEDATKDAEDMKKVLKDVRERLKKAAGVYCGDNIGDKGEVKPDLIEKYLKLDVQRYPHWVNDTWDSVRIKLKLYDARVEDQSTSYHTDLCAEMTYNGGKGKEYVLIPAGYGWSETAPLFYKLGGNAERNRGKSRQRDVSGGSLFSLAVDRLLPHWTNFESVHVYESKTIDEADTNGACTPKKEGGPLLKTEGVSVSAWPFLSLALVSLGLFLGTFMEERHWQKLRNAFGQVRDRLRFSVPRLFLLTLVFLPALVCLGLVLDDAYGSDFWRSIEEHDLLIAAVMLVLLGFLIALLSKGLLQWVCNRQGRRQPTE